MYKWSHEMGYLVGLMASDGCLYNDRRHLAFVSTDRMLLEFVCEILDRPLSLIKAHDTGRSHPGKGDAFRVQWSDVAFYDFLIMIGLTPAKSKTLGDLNIPNVFYGDFLRGYFDGDGSVYGYRDKRWRSAFCFYTSYISASKTFLDHIRNKNRELYGIGAGSLNPCKGAFILRYAKQDSRSLYGALYANVSRYYLKRKHDVYKGFIETT